MHGGVLLPHQMIIHLQILILPLRFIFIYSFLKIFIGILFFVLDEIF